MLYIKTFLEVKSTEKEGNHYLAKIKQIIIVLANYCPHCVPLSLQYVKRMAEDFNVPLQIFNVEISDQEKLADHLVEEYGDWSEDYLIPQVFIEYTDGTVQHIFTGFSEAVSVTEACWETFFSSKYYKNLLQEQSVMEHTDLKDFIEKYLIFSGRCRRHCRMLTSFTYLWHDSKSVVGAYVCPDGYVSRVIYFSVDPDTQWFKSFLTSQLGENTVQHRDLRPATRYGWELGNGSLDELRDVSSLAVIKEVYWTYYPRTKTGKTDGVFLCSNSEQGTGCGRLFVQDIGLTDKLCLKCR